MAVLVGCGPGQPLHLVRTAIGWAGAVKRATVETNSSGVELGTCQQDT